MIIRLISVLLVLIGSAGFLAPFWIGAVPNINAVELPLSAISDVAISDEGDLYIAIASHGRIQKYSPDGKFLGGFEIEFAGGAFCLDIDGSELTVSIARRDAADVFDLSGNIISANTPISEDEYHESCRKDAQIDSRLDRTIVSFDDGQSITIKRKSWHYLALNTFASWGMFVIGLLLFPEWRRAVFSGFWPTRKSRNVAKSRGLLGIANIIANLILTAFLLVFIAIGLGIFSLVADSVTNKYGLFFSLAFALIWMMFPFYGIYRIWTHFPDEIPIAPGFSIDASPGAVVASKFISIFLLVAFIFSVFFFGERWAQRSGYYDEAPTGLTPGDS